MIEFQEIKNEQSSVNVLANLASEIWHEYWTGILSLKQIDYMVDKFQSEYAIIAQMRNENYVYFYILSEGEKAGYIGMSKKDSYLFLSKLYIKNLFRHKGIGTESFEFIKKYAKGNNYKKIRLTVNKYNKNTIDAYNKWGFKTIDSVVTDIGNGFVMDDYIMEYDL
jgi:RimJ/RimL family protein N-acetyltransferase